jgi:hypothetical protein
LPAKYAKERERVKGFFRVVRVKLFAIVVGVWGAWQFLKSRFMILAPKSEPGDVAEQ